MTGDSSVLKDTMIILHYIDKSIHTGFEKDDVALLEQIVTLFDKLYETEQHKILRKTHRNRGNKCLLSTIRYELCTITCSITFTNCFEFGACLRKCSIIVT